MAQYGWIIDVTRCIGCRACVASCINENNTDPYLRWRDVLEVEEGGTVSLAENTTVSMACFHCANPACKNACPVGAISKDASTGVVLIDQSLCIGCRRCEAACPYGAPRFDPNTKKMYKCTFCAHRLMSGSTNPEDLVPACVSTCPGKALWFGEVSAAPTYGKQLVLASSTPPTGFASPSYTTPSVQFARVAT